TTNPRRVGTVVRGDPSGDPQTRDHHPDRSQPAARHPHIPLDPHRVPAPSHPRRRYPSGYLPTAFRACLSRVRGKPASPVLRGRRRSDAPSLPDWKGAYYLLEADGFECWLVNARDVKNVPGRPKTDKADALWLAQVAERGVCRPSLVHPRPIRQLRDLTRYRRSLTQDRTREMQRVEKLLEDAQVKLSSVISDIFGVSGRQMLEALIVGQRDPAVLAQMARGSMRK